MSRQPDWICATVARTEEIAQRVRLIELALPDAGPPVEPGSHLNVRVFVNGRAEQRSYSVVTGGDGRVRIAVRQLPRGRGGSAYLWRLERGASLRVSGPRNLFRLTYGRPSYLLIAGGIGITPLYAMALTLAARNEPLRMLYAGRRRSELPFVSELAERLGDRLEVFASDEGTRIDLGSEIDRLAPGGLLYLCGPLRLREAARVAWRQSGRPAEDLRFETFGNSGHHPSRPFTVLIPRLGKTVEVAEEQSMLEALEEAGVAMISDCLRGECGLCVVDVLDADGVLDHRDVFFSERQRAEGTRLCTCVSRLAGARVTIDTADRGGPFGVTGQGLGIVRGDR